jgi:uncharacterized protein (TIGR02271 family)
MAYEKVVALFDTDEHARAALRALEAAGFPSRDISLLHKDGTGVDRESVDSLGAAGFWQRVFGLGLQKADAEVYGHTVEKGGVVLTVRVLEDDVDRAMEVLHVHKTVDVDQRASALGFVSAPVKPAASVAVAAPVVRPAPVAPAPVAPAPRPVERAAPEPAARVASGDEVVRLAEEQLNVGKRQVLAGTTKIRRFVVEKPVEAQVTLHEEHAEVLRHAITNPTYVTDVDWSDRTIEVEETAEQAVVSKTARIAEEVIVRREGSDRVETVHDTVRRQQIEVEKTSAGKTTKEDKRG